MIDPNEIKYSLQPKNEIWQVVFYVNGKYYWRSTKVRVPNMNQASNLYKNSKNEAAALIPVLKEQLIKKLENPNAPQQTPIKQKKKITVVELIKDWLEVSAALEVRASTYSTYVMYAKHRIYPFFNTYYPDLAAEEITHEIMLEFIRTMKADGLKKNSIKKYLVPIRNAYNSAEDDGIIEKNPVGDFQYKPKRKTKQDQETKVTDRKAYNKRQCVALQEAIEKEIDKPIVIAVVLAYKLGMRREEILGLRFSDFLLFDNDDEGAVTVANTVTRVTRVIEEKDTKSSAGARTIPLDAWTVKYIKALKARYHQMKQDDPNWDNHGYVFVRDDGQRYYPTSVTKLLSNFLKRNNLEKITLHELRHTFCTNAIASGLDATTVQYLMGHEDSRMTIDLYSHPSLEKILGCAEQLHGYVNAA